MDRVPKRITREIRQLAGVAYERELTRELQELREQFNQGDGARAQGWLMRTAKAVRSAAVLLIAQTVLVTACGSTRPSSTSLEGQWSGTTAQGTPITFTVSADQKVTAITVAYRFGGCAGTQTFDNLNLETAPNVVCVPGPCSPSITSYRAFNYSTARSLEEPSTSLNALFITTGSAEGQVGFRNFPDCGSATGVSWTAAKR